MPEVCIYKNKKLKEQKVSFVNQKNIKQTLFRSFNNKLLLRIISSLVLIQNRFIKIIVKSPALICLTFPFVKRVPCDKS